MLPVLLPPHQDPAVPAEDQSAATGSHSHVFSLAVSTLIPLDTWASGSTHSTSTQVETCTAEEVVALALAAHHPAITAGVRNQQHTWSAALAKCRAIRARITGRLINNMSCCVVAMVTCALSATSACYACAWCMLKHDRSLCVVYQLPHIAEYHLCSLLLSPICFWS